MKFLILFYAFFSFSSAWAGIFGPDNRIEAQTEAPAFWREKAKSVPALIPKEYMENVQGGYRLKGISLTKDYGLCGGQRFSEQRIVANCSASLVDEDVILTAGHCLNKEYDRGHDDYFIVFDYVVTKGRDPHFIPEENVYKSKEVLYKVFDLNFTEDLALIKLSSKVQGRSPIILDKKIPQVDDELTMIGYPLGIFQKFVDGGFITEVERKKLSFKHTLDTFSVNSGGPVFDARTGHQVGVLVRGTGPNIEKRRNQKCGKWGKSVINEDFAEANFLKHLPFEQNF